MHLVKGGRTTPRGRSELGSIVSEVLGSLTVFVSPQPFFPAGREPLFSRALLETRLSIPLRVLPPKREPFFPKEALFPTSTEESAIGLPPSPQKVKKD